MEIPDVRRLGSPALPGCAIGGKSQTNHRMTVVGVFVCNFPPIVPAAKGGAQPCAFMAFMTFMVRALSARVCRS